MAIEIFVDVAYVISQLDYTMSPSSKIWVWLQTRHTHFLTLHLETPLLKF